MVFLKVCFHDDLKHLFADLLSNQMIDWGRGDPLKYS